MGDILWNQIKIETGKWNEMHFKDRMYYIYIPKSVEKMKIEGEINIGDGKITMPLVINFHGFTGTPERDFSKFDSLSEIYKFIAVLPVGLERSWNAIYCCVCYAVVCVSPHIYLHVFMFLCM